jgi:DNA-binding NtrC family response regulator
MAPEVVEFLQAHDWPGNVRELRNSIEQMLLAAGPGRITMEHVPPMLSGREIVSRVARLVRGQMPLSTLMADLEKELVVEAMRRTGGNKARAAELLGISRPTLYEKLKAYGLGTPEEAEAPPAEPAPAPPDAATP